MDHGNDILALIPARGGSKGIPGKNLAPLAGRPMIEYTFDAALGSRLLTRCIISTDAPEIAASAERAGIEVPFLRPPELAQDDSATIDAVNHALDILAERESYRPDVVVLLQPTSPLRTAAHIDRALELMFERKADSVVGVVPVPHVFNPVSIMQLNEQGYLRPFSALANGPILRRQDKPVVYSRNGAAVYACLRDVIRLHGSLMGPHCVPYHMNRADSVDVDEPLDLLLCEAILADRANRNLLGHPRPDEM